METNSVSEGSFLFIPKNFNLSKLKKRRKFLNKRILEKWNIAFNDVWNIIEKEVKDVNNKQFHKVLENLIKHVKTLHSDIKFEDGVLPCEILLTGTNLPDHNLLVSALSESVKEVTSYFSILKPQVCTNIKNTISSLVQQITSSAFDGNSEISEDSEEDNLENEKKSSGVPKLKFQVSQCIMSALNAWYSNQNNNNKVIIFLPDFECFSPKVLAELIHILSSYSSMIPMVLIFGVATTPGAVHQSLPHSVLCHLTTHLFKSEPSISFLNQVIEKILFSEKCPFRLGSKCMTFLTDIFLFHSFSVQGFIQGFKYCMMEHFYKKNHFALCGPLEILDKEIKKITDDDLEKIRRIPSFQKYVEKSSKSDRALLLLNNDHTKKIVLEMMQSLHEYLNNFHVALKCLHILTQDLPQHPLGRHLREYYCSAISSDVRESNEYKTCMRLLNFQMKQELLTKISLVIKLLKLNSLLDILSLDKSTKFDSICSSLEFFKKKIDEMVINETADKQADPNKDFETVKKSLLEFIQKDIFNKMLYPIVTLPLYEIILFDDLPAIRRRISGSPRSAIHLALNNPQFYLECECCTLPHAEAVIPTLPDLSVIYKLHLEFGKTINLYDWLQAFAACVKPEQAEAETQADEQLQARFMRAVSELQFLGFIKPSRSKSDYVNRLTWGSI